jgi:maleate isomerase
MTGEIAMRRVVIGEPPGARARIGLIGLASGMTTEAEMHRLIPQDGVLLVSTRVRDTNTVSLSDLAEMEADLARAASTLLPGERLDVIAYGCTSGAVAIGEAAVTKSIHSVRPGIPVTNQFRSSVSALGTVGASRISLVSPYTQTVTREVVRHLELEGIEVVHAVAFGMELGSDICGLSPETVLGETLAADRVEANGIFICCGGLPTLGMLEEAERCLEKPVVSSNQSLAWHSLRLAGVDDPRRGCGRLLRTPPANKEQAIDFS